MLNWKSLISRAIFKWLWCSPVALASPTNAKNLPAGPVFILAAAKSLSSAMVTAQTATRSTALNANAIR